MHLTLQTSCNQQWHVPSSATQCEGKAQQQHARRTRQTRAHHVAPSVHALSKLSWARVQAFESEICASPFKPLATNSGRCRLALLYHLGGSCVNIACTADSGQLQLPLLQLQVRYHGLERQPSAQPRPITSGLQTEAECTDNSPLAMHLRVDILGDGGVHIDPTACPKHLPLSFGASTPSQASIWLPAISSAMPHHISASN